MEAVITFVSRHHAAQLRGKTVPECILTAQYTARVILQHPGCSYPATGPDASFL